MNLLKNCADLYKYDVLVKMLTEHFDQPSGLDSMAGSDTTMRIQISLQMHGQTDHELHKRLRVVMTIQSDHKFIEVYNNVCSMGFT